MKVSGADKRSVENEIHQWGGGITLLELLELPGVQSKIVQIVIRRGEASFDDLSFELKKKGPELKEILDKLAAKGFLGIFDVEGENRYKIMIAKKTKRDLPPHIWGILVDEGE